MGHYVLLVKITEKGKEDISRTLKTREDVMAYLKELGGSHKSLFMTLGRYDAIEVIDLPDDNAAMKFAVKAGQTGDVRLETLKAFTEEEMRRVTSSM